MLLLAGIPLLVFGAYISLAVFMVRAGLTTLARKALLSFLLANCLVAFSSFMMHANIWQPTVWLKFLGSAGTAAFAALVHFSLLYSGVKWKRLYINGLFHTTGGIIIVLVAAGKLMVSAEYVGDGVVNITFSPWMPAAYAYMFLAGMTAVIILILQARRAQSIINRRRTEYLVAAAALYALAPFANAVPRLSSYPVDQSIMLLTSGIISYALVRYQLLDVPWLIRRALPAALIAAPFILFYLALMLSLVWTIGYRGHYVFVIIVAVCLAVAIGVFSRYGRTLYAFLSRRILGLQFEYSQVLRDFSNSMATIIDQQELSVKLVVLAAQLVKARKAALYLFKRGKGVYELEVARGLESQGEGWVFPADSPVIKRLVSSRKVLEQETIESFTASLGSWQSERSQLESLEASLIVPLRSGNKLVGVLILGDVSSSLHGKDVLQLLEVVGVQAGVALENSMLYAEAKEMANRDSLTGLYNHRHFHECLEEEITQAARGGYGFSVVLTDIDGFKEFNDRWGHLAGDELLKKLGEAIGSGIKEQDLAFRYGGDEFALLLRHTDQAQAKGVADRIRVKVRTIAGEDVSLLPTLLSLSAGIAQYPVDSISRSGLIMMADIALYESKRRGGNLTFLVTDLGSLTRESPEMEAATNGSVYALATAVDARAPFTRGHSTRVAELCVAMGKVLNLPVEKLIILRSAALLHDVGKIAIPDRVLAKDMPLDSEEQIIMKGHSSEGAKIVGKIPELAATLPAIIHHHEWYNGKGYPSGLQGDNIPVESRIIALADAFDTMTTPRSYRKLFSREETLEEIVRYSGTQFDPKLVEVLSEVIKSPNR